MKYFFIKEKKATCGCGIGKPFLSCNKNTKQLKVLWIYCLLGSVGKWGLLHSVSQSLSVSPGGNHETIGW